ncbi:hypothetical protein [Halomonas sp. NO4]|uniref:hypothetical protein n=1 Tax=Halomonas sp. NO4 TaxID=2484813 RepID=UPI0013D329C0|nr:hypothetical protein [Halomonas sp. NO4]
MNAVTTTSRRQRRRLLATLGVAAATAYVAPTLFTLGQAQARHGAVQGSRPSRSRPSYSRPSRSHPSYSRPSRRDHDRGYPDRANRRWQHESRRRDWHRHDRQDRRASRRLYVRWPSRW